MALGITPIAREPALKFGAFDLSLDDSYPAGGHPLTPGDYGLSELVAVIPLGSPGFVVLHDTKTGKLRLFQTGNVVSSPLQEVPVGTDLSAAKVRVLVAGR